MSPIDGNGMHDRVPTSYVDRIGDEPRREYTKDALRDIGWALKQMHDRARVRRAGWNGKGMFLFLVPGSEFQVNRPPLLGIYPEGTWIKYHAHVGMKTATGDIVPWLCSQTDLLATDWEIA